MKKRVISILLSMMLIGSMAGCSSGGSGDSGDGDSASSDLPYAGEEISILWVSNSTMY